jgi:hypothetical protein
MATYNLTDLTDPQKFQAKYPATVKAINPVYWNAVELDMYVKIRRESEYFWVQVRKIDGCTITGEVYYELGTNNFNIGDLLVFDKCYQFDIYDQQIFDLVPGMNRYSSHSAATRDWTSVQGPPTTSSKC